MAASNVSGETRMLVDNGHPSATQQFDCKEEDRDIPHGRDEPFRPYLCCTCRPRLWCFDGLHLLPGIVRNAAHALPFPAFRIADQERRGTSSSLLNSFQISCDRKPSSPDLSGSAFPHIPRLNRLLRCVLIAQLRKTLRRLWPLRRWGRRRRDGRRSVLHGRRSVVGVVGIPAIVRAILVTVVRRRIGIRCRLL